MKVDRNFFLNLFLHWVFTAEHKFSLVVTSGGYCLIAVCGLLIAMASLGRLVGVLGTAAVGLCPATQAAAVAVKQAKKTTAGNQPAAPTLESDFSLS